MSFGEAITTCLKKYVTFSGRARRSEYWYFFLLVAAVYGLTFLGPVIKVSLVSMLGTVGFFALLLPMLAVTVRRLHDTGRTGWFVLINLIPLIGGIVLAILLADDTDPSGDKYGPSPKAVPAAA